MSNEASKGPGVERDWDEDPQELDAGRLEPTPTSGWTTGDWFDRASSLDSATRTRLLVEAAKVGLWDWNLVTNEVYLSPEWKRQLGYTDLEMPNGLEEWESRLHPADRETTLAAVEDFHHGRRATYDVEFRLRHKDGSYRWILTQADLSRNSDGVAIRMVGSHIDITARKQVEEALRVSDRRLAELISNVDGIAWEADVETFRMTFVSQQAERILGYPASDWTREGFWEAHLHPDDRVPASTFCVAETKHGRDHRFEYRMIAADGRIVWLEDFVTVTSKDGKPHLLHGVMVDITARKHVEAALRESEQRLQYALDASCDGLWDWDVASGSVHYSARWAELLGYAPEEVPQRVEFFLQSLHPEDGPQMTQVLEAHFAGRIPVKQGEVRMRTKSGEYRWFLDRGKVVVRDEAGKPVRMVGTITDITDRKAVENINAQSLASLRATIDSTADGILAVGSDGQIEAFNRPFASMWGIPAEVLASRSNDAVVELARDQVAEPEAFLERIDYLDAHPFEGSADTLTLLDGRIFQRSSQPMLIQDRPVGRVWSYCDVTERKKAEMEKARLEVQLQQAQKLDSIGRLAGGVAHDFNNMLGVILASTEMALDAVDPAHSVHEDLLEIKTATLRSSNLARQLLAFARKQVVAPKVLDLNATVTSSLGMVARVIGENVKVAWTPGENVWPVRMDPSQAEQVLTNLCINARDAIDDVGTISVETTNSEIRAEFCALHRDALPGEYVRLSVRDDGSGMDSEMLVQIFEPFYTTKRLGDGTGLGLSTVYGAVRQNHGFITVQSAPGKGTLFDIYLPREVGPLESEDSPPPPASSRRASGGETILLVEDEPSILKLVTRALVSQGYVVLGASGPREAIRLARERSGPIHLLLTDVVMPEMNGRALGDTLRTFLPRFGSLFMSGYSSDVIAPHGVLEEGLCFIQKPFSISALAAEVRRVLDANPPEHATSPECAG